MKRRTLLGLLSACLTPLSELAAKKKPVSFPSDYGGFDPAIYPPYIAMRRKEYINNNSTKVDVLYAENPRPLTMEDMPKATGMLVQHDTLGVVLLAAWEQTFYDAEFSAEHVVVVGGPDMTLYPVSRGDLSSIPPPWYPATPPTFTIQPK